MGDDGKKAITAPPKILLLVVAYALEFWYGLVDMEPPFRI